MNFDPKQISEIKKTMKVLVKDMRTLYQIYPYENIEVGIPILVGDHCESYGDYWKLVISEKNIILFSNMYDNRTFLERKGTKKAIYTAGELEAHYKFISRYDKIREEIEKIVQERVQKSSISIAKMREYQQRYCHEATIEIEVPAVNNQQLLEVEEINGQKIGVLSFNGLTLRIIASAGIKIVNKTPPKQKRK